jgi:Catalase
VRFAIRLSQSALVDIARDRVRSGLVLKRTTFFIKDPIKFPDFVHTQKRDPQTNLKSAQITMGPSFIADSSATPDDSYASFAAN